MFPSSSPFYPPPPSPFLSSRERYFFLFRRDGQFASSHLTSSYNILHGVRSLEMFFQSFAAQTATGNKAFRGIALHNFSPRSSVLLTRARIQTVSSSSTSSSSYFVRIFVWFWSDPWTNHPTESFVRLLVENTTNFVSKLHKHSYV